MDDNPVTLDDIQRRLAVIEHELDGMRITGPGGKPPANIAEVTLMYRRVQEAQFYGDKAKEKQQG